MARKPKSFTDETIAAMPLPRKGRVTKADTDQRGLYIQITAKGARSFYVVKRNQDGKQIWKKIGSTAIGIEAARVKAREVIGKIETGADLGGKQTFAAVADQWLKRHVEASGLRSEREIRRYLDKWILPAWSGRDFVNIRRQDVAALLDHVQDTAGPVAADSALKRISSICAWYQSRHDDYVSPVVKGMRRSKTAERARDRILEDAELRAVWRAAEANGTFGAFVRVLLLTGQRRDKVASMKWDDVSLDGTWTIATEKREKGNAGKLVLPEAALAILRAQPRFEGNDYVFAGRAGSHISGYSKAKAALDARVAAAGEMVAPWTLHDLRRTARSLLSRAGVLPHVSERVLGHAQDAMPGTYDRHDYRAEKAHALRQLAGLIETILRGPVDNVIPIAG
jgi:integrase